MTRIQKPWQKEPSCSAAQLAQTNAIVSFPGALGSALAVESFLFHEKHTLPLEVEEIFTGVTGRREVRQSIVCLFPEICAKSSVLPLIDQMSHLELCVKSVLPPVLPTD